MGGVFVPVTAAHHHECGRGRAAAPRTDLGRSRTPHGRVARPPAGTHRPRAGGYAAHDGEQRHPGDDPAERRLAPRHPSRTAQPMPPWRSDGKRHLTSPRAPTSSPSGCSHSPTPPLGSSMQRWSPSSTPSSRRASSSEGMRAERMAPTVDGDPRGRGRVPATWGITWPGCSPRTVRCPGRARRSTGRRASSHSVEQRWTGYASSLLAFSAVSVLLLYLLQRAQGVLPLSQGPGACRRPRRSTRPSRSSRTRTGSRIG